MVVDRIAPLVNLAVTLAILGAAISAALLVNRRERVSLHAEELAEVP